MNKAIHSIFTRFTFLVVCLTLNERNALEIPRNQADGFLACEKIIL